MEPTNHEQFQKFLRESRPYVLHVAQWLTSRGHAVTIPPEREAPTEKEWREYSDNGDLYMDGRRVEVKHRSLNFTSRADWPYEDFCVIKKNTFDSAEPKPWAVIVCSKDMKRAGVIMGDTSALWTARSTQDVRFKDLWQDLYYAPLDIVKFISI